MCAALQRGLMHDKLSSQTILANALSLRRCVFPRLLMYSYQTAVRFFQIGIGTGVTGLDGTVGAREVNTARTLLTGFLCCLQIRVYIFHARISPAGLSYFTVVASGTISRCRFSAGMLSRRLTFLADSLVYAADACPFFS